MVDKKPSYSVSPFNDKIIPELFSSNGIADEDYIKLKNHTNYFPGYLDSPSLQAKTVVVENHYIDKDYLEDYAAYYSRCFFPYNRVCRRLHFFSISFSKKDFDELLVNNSSSQISYAEIEQNYLGFIVIKPLPQTIVGRTCLKTYHEKNIEREYPTKRNYDVNLFGLKFKIKSIAFQEQDKTVAACATSALWSVFQSTGKTFQHPILSPYKITENATKKYLTLNRPIPNKGLNKHQMGQAIKNVDLDPLHKSVRDEFIFKSTVYAYLKTGLPLILVIDMVEKLEKVPLTQNFKGQFMGKHGVAVTGFRLEGKEIEYNNTGFFSSASRISKLYVHDDQVGPFTRMEFEKKKIQIKSSTYDPGSCDYVLSTGWFDETGTPGTIKAAPDIIFVPLYHKIRIQFATVQDMAIRFNESVITQLKKQGFLTVDRNISWDIYLTQVGDLKKDIRNEALLDENYLLEVLTWDLPKYIWRATIYDDKTKIIDFLFDATDIEQGDFLIQIIEYDLDFCFILKTIAGWSKFKEKYFMKPEWKIIDKLRRAKNEF